MFNMVKVAAYICDLRKRKDLTQSEVADILNVSHQAVSKWERGESLPDVGILPALAEMYGVSIDDILHAGEAVQKKNKYNEGDIVKEIAAGDTQKVEELVKSNEVEVETILNVAPILKRSSIDKMAGAINSSNLRFEHLVALAPFAGKEVLDSLVRKISSYEVNINEIIALAPFLDGKTIEELIQKSKLDNIDIYKLMSLVPFIRNNIADELVEKCNFDGIDVDEISVLAPFLSQKKLDEILSKLE